MVELNPKYKHLVGYAAGATALAAGALFTPWETTRIVGMTVLTGVGYGIINDMFACRDCIEYFTVGHTYDPSNSDLRLLRDDLDPTRNAIVWGAFATWHVAAIGGGIIALASRMPLPWIGKKISASQLAPILGVGTLLLCAVAHHESRKVLNSEETSFSYWGVPENLQKGWAACNRRNSIGYAGLAIGVALLLPSILIARAVFSYRG